MKSCFEYEEIFIFEVTIINWSRVAEFARKAAFVFFLDLDPESEIILWFINSFLQTSHAWRIIAGVVVLGSIISWDWPPLRAARRATSSKWSPGCSELGPSSFIGCHPSGGDAGGDIKNCFSSFGGFFRIKNCTRNFSMKFLELWILSLRNSVSVSGLSQHEWLVRNTRSLFPWKLNKWNLIRARQASTESSNSTRQRLKFGK